jgi:hypothetical protein
MPRRTCRRVFRRGTSGTRVSVFLRCADLLWTRHAGRAGAYRRSTIRRGMFYHLGSYGGSSGSASLVCQSCGI